ncbi:DBH-like monooxygenase protein 1 [Antedon mediterranea]|uniref:DBH-like monooxygenase protein 1 n=1 Tax=Antedon mediterranea TaxID=105859 RepID=UPI003AF9E61C
MSAVTSGYVAIGFSPNGGMPGSDIVVGWVKNGKAFISDRHATAYAKPEADTSQDYTLLYGREEGGRTTIGFSRALKTCDDKDNVLNDDTMRIIWAVNNLDPEDYDDLAYHGSSRGVRSVLLTAAIENRVELPNDAEYFEMFMPNVSVPNDHDTTYWCASFAVPRFERPVHIVIAETIVQKGHEYLVHHLVMYGCKATNTSWSSRCNSERMPPDLQACDRTMIYGWAIGGGPLVLPEHVGISLARKSDPTVIFLEMHYDNPAQSPGKSILFQKLCKTLN